MVQTKIDLAKYINKNVLLEVYQTDHENDFLLGYLVGEMADYYFFQAVDEYGCLDAYTVYLKSYIGKIKINTSYAHFLLIILTISSLQLL